MLGFNRQVTCVFDAKACFRKEKKTVSLERCRNNFFGVTCVLIFKLAIYPALHKPFCSVPLHF